jgi:hypothetical protein
LWKPHWLCLKFLRNQNKKRKKPTFAAACPSRSLLATYGRYTLDVSNPLVGLHCLAASNLLLADTSSNFAKFAKFLSLGTTVDPLKNNGYSDFVPPVDDTATQGEGEKERKVWNTYAFTRSGSQGIRPLATLSTATGNEVLGSVLISPPLLTSPYKQKTKQLPNRRFMTVQNSPALMTKLVADFIDGWVRAERERIGALQRAAGKGS